MTLKQFFLLLMAATVNMALSAQDTASEWPATMASGTLPVVYVDTENAAPIVDKETKIRATLYITVPDGSDSEPLGSADSPVELTIKGRGNSTWLMAKKPYKIKFESKQQVLGMPKHKHFALLPLLGGPISWIAANAGMELGRLSGMPWAPRMEACELVLNGRYDGLYFITESIKIDKNRLDIFEQDDLCDDPELIKGGWLVEIDNYDDPCQIVVRENDKQNLRVTYHTPEELTEAQRDYLTEQFTLMNEAIHSGDKLSEYLDVSSIARYFIVREILHDTDGYNGSFYLFKDLGDDAKWNFGPLWDIVYGGEMTDWTMNDHPDYSAIHWIPEITRTEAFSQALHCEWNALMPKIATLYPFINNLTERCAEAEKVDYRRWGRGSEPTTVVNGYSLIMGIKHNIEWIENNMNRMAGLQSPTPATTSPALWYNLQGVLQSEHSLAPGIYIRVDSEGACKISLSR